MKNLKIYVEKHGKMKIIIIFILIDLRRKEIVLLMTTKTLLLNVFQEVILSKIIFINKIFVQLKITMM